MIPVEIHILAGILLIVFAFVVVLVLAGGMWLWCIIKFEKFLDARNKGRKKIRRRPMNGTTLLFDETASETNNNFHPGLNVTVRRGLKYLELLKPGDPVVMKNLQGEFLGIASVHQMIAGKMVDIPTSILELEHDPKCRDLQSLVEVMQNCYGDPGFDENEVTIAIVLNVIHQSVNHA